jgi:hypothetical protein
MSSLPLFKNYDLLQNLPTDDEELSLKEKTILDTLYPPQSLKNISDDVEKTWFHFKDIIIAVFLFFIINLPMTEKLLEKVVKTDNMYYKLLYKTITFGVLFFIINNFYLSQKSRKN